MHDQLASHPECRLRTIKEYHYFTKSSGSDFDAAITVNDREIARLVAKNETRPAEQGTWARAHIADLQAYNDLLSVRKRDNAGFTRLLSGAAGPGHVLGDFTPAYALMPEPALVQVAEFNEDTRAIYLIRDPVARLWSHVRMLAERAQPAHLAEAAWGLFAKTIRGDEGAECKGIVDRGDYARIIPKLARAFDPSRLLVMFYEEMMTAPGFARICAFLGIDHRPADFSRKVHAGKPLGLTHADRAAAARFLRPQYEFAAQMFPVLPAAWASAMNEA